MNAAQSASLQDVLFSWEPDSSIGDLLTHIPRLSNAIVELARDGLVEVYRSRSARIDGDLVFLDDLPALLGEPANWWTDDGPANFVELVSTSWADATFASRGDEDLYGFRNHNPLDEQPG